MMDALALAPRESLVSRVTARARSALDGEERAIKRRPSSAMESPSRAA